MSDQTPVVRPVSVGAMMISLTILFLAMGLGYWAFQQEGVLAGGILFLGYAIFSRHVITGDQRTGMRLVRQQRFAEAIPCFQRSFEFFERNAWLDNYRAVVLLTPAAMCYREMALANIAFCHSQIGNGAEARRYYETCLERYPNCGLARAALRMMDSAAKA